MDKLHAKFTFVLDIILKKLAQMHGPKASSGSESDKIRTPQRVQRVSRNTLPRGVRECPENWSIRSLAVLGLPQHIFLFQYQILFSQKAFSLIFPKKQDSWKVPELSRKSSKTYIPLNRNLIPKELIDLIHEHNM